uniref:non-specific serine/threonine protein kinase n=1 Tax=Oryza punctata TaxID=4537 RepID=A0A0E0LWM6_ORYPU
MDIDLDRARALRVLGRGAMGTVFLVEARYGGFRYALKVFDKRSGAAYKHDADRRARWELSVLSRLAHPHLPCLLGSAETPDLLAWAVPYCPGGDLNELRYTLPDRVFSPAAIRFYVAETVSALAELHASGVVYRDLKPENVLLRGDGHVTLTDFDLCRLLPPKTAPSSASPQRMFQGGHRPRVSARSEIPLFSHANKPDPLPPAIPSARQQLQNLVRFIMRTDRSELSKKVKSARVSPVSRKPASFASSGAAGAWGKSYSFVGTEEYVAPEMVRGEGHGFAVDWWAVGVLVYEMAYGRTPFKGKNRKETFRNVLLKDVEFAGDSRRRLPELTDLISRLLERDPKKRLGYQGGADEVRAHPFFAGVAWDMLEVVSRPPYIPPPADDDELVGDGKEFSIREYFDKLHQPPPPETESSSSEFSPEF